MSLIRTLALVFPLLLAGCPKGGGLGKGVTVELYPRTGSTCRSVRVGALDTEFETEPVGCDVTVFWESTLGETVPISLGPMGAPPPPKKRWSGATLAGRAVRLGATGLQGLQPERWQVWVERSTVGIQGLTPDQAPLFDLNDRRYVVFVLKEVARSGTVFPLAFRSNERAARLYEEDPAYCAELADDVAIHLGAVDEPVATRRFVESGRLKDFPIFCSNTDTHVFAVDLGNRVEQVFDIEVRSTGRRPRIFRLTTDENANYTVVDVTLEPSTR